MPAHYAAILPNPFIPTPCSCPAHRTIAKLSRKPSARLAREVAKLEGLLSTPKPLKPSRPARKRSKAR
jgi:hypothetical protein